MAKPEWGVKRVCPNCSARFYDLTNDPTTCPSCASVFALEALSERKSAGPAQTRSKAKPKAAPVPAEETSSDDDVVLDDDGDDDDDDDDVLLDDDDEDDDGDLSDIGDVGGGGGDDDEN